MADSLEAGTDLLGLMNEAVLELDTDFRVTAVNRGAVELYGRQPEDLVGRDVDEIARTAPPTSRAAVEHTLRTEGCWSGELEHRRADGTTVVVGSRRAVRRENGRIVGFLEVDEDITARRIAQHLTESAERQLSEFLDSATDYAMYLLDPQGRISRWSASAGRHTGHTDEDVLGRSWSLLFTPSPGIGSCEDLLARAANGPLQLTGEVVRKDGRTFPAIGTLSPLQQLGTVPYGFIVVNHDDSERRHEEAKLRGLLDSAPDAMIGVDPDGAIVFANLQAEALFGYSRAELLGRTMEMLLPEEIRERHVGHRRRFGQQPKTRPMGAGLELSARHRDGSEFPVEVSLSTLETQDGRIVSAAIRDITDRKRAHREIEELNAELRHANDELERRVAERTATLASQAATLKATNDELESFSYSVSHDLRAPLRAIDGFAKLLVARYAGSLPEEGVRHLGKIRGGAKQMGLLIDGLLEFSRLQRQTLLTTRVDVRALARDVWEELAPDRGGRHVEFVVEDLPPVHADPRLFRHVLSNLLSNAVKYSRTRTPAHITIGAERTEDGDAVYFVHDNGVGFDMRYADKLFQVFQRMHRAEEFEGTGIGLALVARIVNRHGGRVWADATPDEGATFYFTLGSSRAAGERAAVV